MDMRLGILGTGMVGKTLAARLAGLENEVMVGTRDPAETLSRNDPDTYGNPPFSVWQEEHPEVRLGTLAEAAGHGEMVVNATAGAVSLGALELAGEENLSGKVLMDVSNPLDFSKGMPPTIQHTRLSMADWSGLLLVQDLAAREAPGDVVSLSL
jgi:8-hydroxy-5-deazaflavin:NADPH oxidoreductase